MFTVAALSCAYEFHMSLRRRKGKVDLVGVEAKATSNVNDNE